MSKFCVIGKGLAHTLSPRIHAAFGNGGYGVEEIEDVAALAKFVADKKYDGYNVTIPYKRDVVRLLDEVDGEAAAVGAVNTVINVGGKSIGFNTDIEGMRFAAERAGIDFFGKDVAVLGSGGASQTAQYLARREGAKSVAVVSRGGKINYDNFYDLINPQIIVNATPVGMYPSAYSKPIELSRLSRAEAVFDCVYNPLETLLVAEAKELGLVAASGFDMLIEQARLANNIFARTRDIEVCDREKCDMVCRSLKRELKNIVLVGMAGCGKSAVGAELARMTGRKFLDTDEIVKLRAQKSASEIIEEEGEEKFRLYEKEAVKSACLEMGAAIATGGGAVLDEENRFYMRANGVVVLLTRDIEELAHDMRPLSRDIESARALYQKRRTIYQKVADVTVHNDGSIEDAANKILRATEELL